MTVASRTPSERREPSILDQGRKPDETPHFWSYFPEQWKGIEGVDDSTPGFSVVLSRDDMRLYKIDAVN